MLALALVSALALVHAQAATPGDEIRQGTLEITVSDDFDGGASQREYALVSDGERIPLAFDGPPPLDWRTGDQVEVEGTVSGGVLAVRQSERLSTAVPPGTPAPAGWTTGPKKVLAILVNFTNDAVQPYTTTQVQNALFGASGSVAAYYNEVSNGQTTLSGDVTPWLTLPIAKPTTCDWPTIGSQGSAAATSHGYNLANYQFPVYIFPSLSSCGWAGLAYVGGGGAWINQALSTYVVGHELGHNYGLEHAHSYDCVASAFASTGCGRSEYGDPFDIMGGAARHFSAYAKSYLTWLPAVSITTVSTGITSVGLSPIESASGMRAIQVQTTKGRTYWVEFRQQSTGFDSGLPANVTGGALIHLAPSPVGGIDLLDMTPDGSASGSFNDAALDVSQSFVDAAAGLTVTTTAKTSSTLTVQVDYGTFPAPAVSSLNPPSGSAAGGTTTTLTGSGFLPGLAVSIGGVAATPTAIGASSVTVKTGAHAVGDVDVVVTNADAQASPTLTKGYFYDFADVAPTSAIHPFVLKLYRDGVTAGCTGSTYCPNDSVTRAQMAVFLLRSEHGIAYVPPGATGTVFADVSATSFAAAWIERLYAESITGGCATSPLRYCPTSAVTRGQMAVLLLRGEHGSAYVPPGASGVFSDVPATDAQAPWVEQLYAEGITGGCGTSPLRYCPSSPATRGQMAVFLATTFHLP